MLLFLSFPFVFLSLSFPYLCLFFSAILSLYLHCFFSFHFLLSSSSFHSPFPFIPSLFVPSPWKQCLKISLPHPGWIVTVSQTVSLRTLSSVPHSLTALIEFCSGSWKIRQGNKVGSLERPKGFFGPRWRCRTERAELAYWTTSLAPEADWGAAGDLHVLAMRQKTA